MSATLINLIIQLVAGAVGGNAAGAANKNVDLGALGNTIAGALGGAGGGTNRQLDGIAVATILSFSDLWRASHAPLKIESDN